MVRSAHFSLIPLMVAQSLLVLTTGRLFCSRYVDALPVRIVRCPVAFPPLTYYQLWHDLTHASPAVRWLREQVKDVARNLSSHGMLQRGRATRSGDGGTPRATPDRTERSWASIHRPRARRRAGRTRPATGVGAGARRHRLRCAATCSTSRADPAWGDVGVRRGALPARPLAADRGRPHRRRAGRGARRQLDAPRPPRPADPAGLHRHPCAQPAARRHRELRHRAARLARAAHLPGRDPLCRRGACRGRRGAVPRRADRARHDRRRSSSRPCTRSRPMRCSRPARRAACG